MKQRFVRLTGRQAVALLAGALAAAMAWGVVSALAASPSSSPSPSGANKIVLQVGFEDTVDNLNPFIGYALVSYDIYDLNYDFLVNYDAATLKPVPGIAESWEHSPDGKVWTFHIRHGVTWQDGQPLTAQDVAFTYNYVVDHQMANFTSYTTWIKHVTATDAYTAVFTCSQPKANMLQMWVPILPEHIWSKISPSDARNKFENPPPIIGSGPFQVVKWVRNQYVLMVANKHYWAGAPKIDELVFRSYTNADTMVEELQQGSIQYAGVSPAQFQRYTHKAGFAAVETVSDSFDEIGINCYTGSSLGNPVLKDWRFRQALNYAIDRNKIAAIAYHGAAIPATGFLPSNYWKPPFDYHWSPPADQAYSYDPAKAKALLAAAGYTDTNGDGYLDYRGKPIGLRLWADSSTNNYIATGKLVTGWLQAIGLKVTFGTMDDGALNSHIYNLVNGKFTPDYDLFIWGWNGDFDPGFLLSVLTTKQINGWSDSGWSNPTYDKLFTDQYKELDTGKRVQLVQQMQQIVYEQTPYIVYAYPESMEVYDTAHWQGWVREPAGTGSVDDHWTYLDVRPKAGAKITSSPIGIIAGIAAAAIVVIAAIIWLVLRRRADKAALEE